MQECNAKIADKEGEIQSRLDDVEKARAAVYQIDKEISDADNTMSNLRNNLRVRKLVKDITETQTEIDSYDMEEAARAKRIFQERYKIEKDRETDMQAKVSGDLKYRGWVEGLPTLHQYAHLGGELSSCESQLKQLEGDMHDFKDVHKKYRDQLVRVKVCLF